MNILLTGVSKGLGLITAEALLLEGHVVYGVSRSMSPQLEELQKKNQSNLKWLSCDLGEIDDLQDVIYKKWIGFNTVIHGLVNNAALAYDDIATNINLVSLEKMYKLNVFSPMILTKYFIRNLLYHHAKGSIVHISSISVHTGYKGLSMYASSKGALEAFSKNLSREWGELGIRSNCVVAGFMETDMSSSLSVDQKNRIYKRTSLKEPVNLYSVAKTIEFLLSEKSSSITGQNFHVDSGTI